MWRWVAGGLVLVAVGGLMLTPSSSSRASRFRDVVIRVPQPAGLTRQQVKAEAARIGVPFHHLLLAIVLGSERATSLALVAGFRPELRAIAACGFNRTRYPGTFGRTWWEVLVGDRETTGAQGDRPFATSLQGATTFGGEHLGELLELVRAVEEAQAQGKNLSGITNFHHYRDEDKARVDATWKRRGYVEVRVPGAPLATFFAPGEAKKRSLT